MVVSGWALGSSPAALVASALAASGGRTLQHAHPVPIVGLPPNMKESVCKPLICLAQAAQEGLWLADAALAAAHQSGASVPPMVHRAKKSPGLATRA